MDISLRTKEIDLYTAKTRNREQERYAIFEIEKQILQWLKDNKLEKELHSYKNINILINKLVYYISKEFQAKNPKLIITRGWYRYGPCFELGRNSEDSMHLGWFGRIELNRQQKVPEETSEVCEEQVPVFIKKTDEDMFPHDYIEYVYRKKCDFEWLKEFYLTKHKLTKDVYNFTKVNEEELIDSFIDFDRAILDKCYLGRANIPRLDINTILDFTSLLSEETRNCDHSSYFESLRDYFNNNIISIFAFKNYVATLTSSNVAHQKVINWRLKGNYTRYLNDLKNDLVLFRST